MHVRVLAAIAAEPPPVASELFRRCAVLLFPKAILDDTGDIGEQPVGVRMASDLGGSCGEQHESVAIGLLGVIGGPLVTGGPEVAAVGGVAVAGPQVVHAVVDHGVRTRPAHQLGDGVAVDHSRRGMDLAGSRGFRVERRPAAAGRRRPDRRSRRQDRCFEPSKKSSSSLARASSQARWVGISTHFLTEEPALISVSRRPFRDSGTTRWPVASVAVSGIRVRKDSALPPERIRSAPARWRR